MRLEFCICTSYFVPQSFFFSLRYLDVYFLNLDMSQPLENIRNGQMSMKNLKCVRVCNLVETFLYRMDMSDFEIKSFKYFVIGKSLEAKLNIYVKLRTFIHLIHGRNLILMIL